MAEAEFNLGNIRGPEGLGIWTTASAINASGTTANINPAAVAGRTVKPGDLVVSSHASSPGVYGRVTAVSSQSSVTAAYAGSLRGAAGATSSGATLAQVQSGFKLECRSFRPPTACTIMYLGNAGTENMLNLGDGLYVKAQFRTDQPISQSNPHPYQYGSPALDSNVIFALNYFNNYSLGELPSMTDGSVDSQHNYYSRARPGIIYVPPGYVGHYLKYDLSATG